MAHTLGIEVAYELRYPDSPKVRYGYDIPIGISVYVARLPSSIGCSMSKWVAVQIHSTHGWVDVRHRGIDVHLEHAVTDIHTHGSH